MAAQEQKSKRIGRVLERARTHLAARRGCYSLNKRLKQGVACNSRDRKNPLDWFRCNRSDNSELSPFRIVWQPSSSEICRWKSCRILIRASFSPGISSPFLIRRMSRIGLISTPTFSSRPRMNAVCTTFQ